MKETFITIVGFNNYFGMKPFSIGAVLTLKKEPENPFDAEAIKAVMPPLGIVGYVANGVNTKANGTLSAGRVYDKVGDKFFAKVMFTTSTKVIARIICADAKNAPETCFFVEGEYEKDDALAPEDV